MHRFVHETRRDRAERQRRTSPPKDAGETPPRPASIAENKRDDLQRPCRHSQPALSKLPGFPQSPLRVTGEAIRHKRRRRAMAQTEAGYRRKWKKWLAIYLAAAAVVYLIVFLVFFNHGGGGGGLGY